MKKIFTKELRQLKTICKNTESLLKVKANLDLFNPELRAKNKTRTLIKKIEIRGFYFIFKFIKYRRRKMIVE